MILPQYLYSLPEGIKPPSQAKLQDLPFENLTWENFERLILRFIEQTGKLEHCRLYGQKGQRQGGIDLFVRQNGEELYSVYQCKRYKSYTKSNLQSAIKKFKEGEWFKKSRRFYICTSCDLSEKKVADEIEIQKNILASDGVELLILDRIKLSDGLKRLPKVVYDFFGREWTKLFCGEEYLVGIGDRLEPHQIAEYRKELGKLYCNLFENHEISLRDISGQKSTPKFADRYIIPDVNKNYSFDYSSEQSEAGPSVKEEQLSSSAAELLGEYEFDHENLESVSESNSTDTTNIENRMCAIDWLATEHNALIVGGAGSGKSALLKYITLGLLGQVEIANTNLIQSKNNLIPVWLPFSYWSNFLENQPNASIVDCLQAWFSGMSHKGLWQLVATAINDNRLLLLVDGIDEWKSERSALVCMQKLSVFISERNASSIISSRPSGVEKLGLNESIWSAAHLEGLSVEQQSTLIKSCIEYRLKNQENFEEKTLRFEFNRLSQELISEISVSQNLTELASVPLLLYMLIHLKSKSISLPHSRYKVYRELVNDLVKVQPKRRKAAAQVIVDSDLFTETELISILANLAYELHVQYPHGSISTSEARAIICNYLTDEKMEFGLQLREAQRLAASFLDISETEVGILVKKSPSEIGFFHRALQEFLAAYYVSTQPDDTQKNALKNFMFNKQWKDVFLGLFTLLERPSDVEKLVDFITSHKSQLHEEWQKEVLLAEVAFGDNKCPAVLAKSIASRTVQIINCGSYVPHRRVLLNILLSGFKSNTLSEEVIAKINTWMPGNIQFFYDLFETVEKYWKADDKSRDLLIKGIELNRLRCKRRAAKGLIRMFEGDINVLKLLMKKIKTSYCFDTKMVLTEVVVTGWKDSKEAAAIYKNIKSIESPVSQLLAVLYETLNSKVSDINRKKLLDFLFDSSLNLEYSWYDVVEFCLESAYLDELLKEEFCKRLFNDDMLLANEFILSILLKYFYKDEVVCQKFLEEIVKDDSHMMYSLRESEQLKNIVAFSPEIHAALEAQILGDGIFSSYYLPVIKTPNVKSYLLEKLKKSRRDTVEVANQLIDNWGIEDSAVREAIDDLIAIEAFNTSLLANRFPDLYKDKNDCFERLMRLLCLKTPKGERKNYASIIQGIVKVADEEQCKSAAEQISESIRSDNEASFKDEESLLEFGRVLKTPEIKNIAIKSLKSRNSAIHKIAAIFSEDDDLRNSILQKFNILPPLLRGAICNKLAQINTQKDAWEILSNYEHEIDPSVGVSAAIGFYSSPLASNSTENVAYYLEKLRDELQAKGRGSEPLHQAAICGLIALRKQIGSGKTVGLDYPITNFSEMVLRPRQNEVFFSFICKNWQFVKDILDMERVDTVKGYEAFFFRNIAPYVDNDPYLKNELKKYLYETENYIDGRLLMAASNTIPKEQTLLKMCFQSLGLVTEEQGKKSRNHRFDSFLAIHILEQQFFNDLKAKEMLDECYANESNSLDVILIVIHAIGYADAPYLNKIKRKLKTKKVWIPALFPSVSQTRGNKNKIDRFDELILVVSKAPKQYAKYLCKTVASEINNSDSLNKEFVKTVRLEKNIQRKLRLLTLLSHTNRLSAEVKDIAIDLFNSQIKKKNCDSFYDVTKGAYSTSLDSLSRILYSE